MKIFIIISASLIILIILALLIAVQKKKPKFNNNGYTPLEKKLLTEVYSLFPPAINKKLQKQIVYFEQKRQWRRYWENCISVELFGNDKTQIPAEIQYKNSDMIKIAIIDFKANNNKYSVEFDSYNGRIWSWKISPNPKSIQKINKIEIINKNIPEQAILS